MTETSSEVQIVPTKDAQPPQEKEPEKQATISEVFGNADQLDYFLMFMGSLAGIVTGVTIPGMSILFGMIIDDLNADGANIKRSMAELCIALVVLAGINFVAGYTQVHFWTRTGERQAQRFRELYVDAILSQEVGWFDQCGANGLATQVADLTGKTQDGITRKIGDFIQYSSQILSSIGVAFYYNWKITLVMLGTVPLMGLAGTFMISAITSAQSQSLADYAAAGSVATESLTAIRTVAALNAQPHFINRYRAHILQAMRVGMVKSFKVGLGNGLMFGVYLLIYALGFWYGGELVAGSLRDDCGADCGVTGGKVLTVFLCVTIGSEALGQMAPPMAAFAGAKAAVASMLQVVRRAPLIDGLSDAGRVLCREHIVGAVELRDVHFAYPSRPHQSVCNGLSLRIQPGETVALVGPSGCGKSTLVNLLLRFYDPRRGAILLDGEDTRHVNVRSLRAALGYVGQEPVLFPGSIAANIAVGLGAEHGLDAEEVQRRVEAAARAANAHDFIAAFPQGYATSANHGNAGLSLLSGGQKQRIAIARALIKKPAVLLLDEATSALDASSERVVQQSIDALAQSRAQTTIIIAHRLSTVRNADKICVLDGGRIVEMGRHEDLLAMRGVYADLVRLQLGAADAETSGDGADGAVIEAAPTPVLIAEGSGSVQALSGPALGMEAAAMGGPASNLLPSATGAEKGTGTGEVSEGDEAASAGAGAQHTAWRVWALLRQYPVLLAVSLAGSLAFGGTFPAWGYLLARAQASFYYDTPGEVRSQSTFYALLFVLVAGVAFFSAIAQYYCILCIGEKLAFQFRSDMFEALMRQPLQFFDSPRHSVGALTTALAEDTRAVHKAFGEALAKQLMAAASVVVGITLAFLSSWKVSLVVLATFPLLVAAAAVQMQAFQGQQHEDVAAAGRKDAAADVSPGTLLSMAFTQMRTLSAFSLHRQVSQDYARITRTLRDQRVQRSHLAAAGYGASNSIMLATYALMFWYGGELIAAGELSFEDMFSAMTGLLFAAMGLGQALTESGDQKAALAASARIFALVDSAAASSIDGLATTTGLRPVVHGRIELRGVRFAYPSRPNVDVCRDYSLTVEAGETVALVGPSGAGKSTIINLLLRYYDPLEGQVLVDGVDVRDCNVRWLRSNIGYVSQEPVLFEGSVHENVQCGRKEMAQEAVVPVQHLLQASSSSSSSSAVTSCASPCCDCLRSYSSANVVADEEMGLPGDTVAADVQEACRAANAHDFIAAFPQGYATSVGTASVMISGGQKQRIAIARALIKKPAVLLLDEATSALDASSERVVQQSIDALAQSRAQTTIIIAHRLSTVRNADKICVLDGGRIVEMGRHEDLLADGSSLYAQLWNKQYGGRQGTDNSEEGSTPQPQA